MQQFNFVLQMEEEERRNRYWAKVRKHYPLWLKAPDLLIVPIEDREKMMRYPDQTGYDIYSSVVHYCEGGVINDRMPWCNTGVRVGEGGEYWVLPPEEGFEGEVIEDCPYCGARLSKGEGQIALRKNRHRERYYNEPGVRKMLGLEGEE